MTKEEALVFLNCSDSEEWEDEFDRQLFAIKTHFISKPLLFKTAQPKLKSLKQLEQVQQLLALKTEDSSWLPFQYRKEEQNDCFSWWIAYSAFRSEWKLQISRSARPIQMIRLIELGFQIEIDFLSRIPSFNWIDQAPIIGIESDAMMIQNQLLIAKNKGWIRFEDLFQHKNELPIELLLALKRLSLLHTYMIE